MMLKTSRLTLRNWQDADRNPFAAMNADHEVMWDLGGPLDRAQSDAKFDRYVAAFDRHGFCRWALEDSEGRFVDYTGVMPASPAHPLGYHAEIGWRLMRSVWGLGYATEAAKAALQDVFARVGLKEVLSYTSPDNIRSRAVMERLDLERDVTRDFTGLYDNEIWHGWVWVARPMS